jgi:muramoyltetrapeptide carboxypeptidase
MITPPYLKKGQTIGIVAPARYIEQSKYPYIINLIESKGYKVARGKTTFLLHNIFAGTADERAEDLQQMIDNDNIATIFCLRGGYGTVQIIDKINFAKLGKQPKWIVGFSDITVLHNALTNTGIESIHGQMPVNFPEKSESIDMLFNTLEGKSLRYNINTNSLNRQGRASGLLTGGNIAVLTSLAATPFDVHWDNKILFIEETGEYLYRLERMMYQLKLSGKLANLTGLIVGGLSSMQDNNIPFGKNARQIIFDAVKDYNYPVCFGFPAGHIKDNMPLIFNRKIEMNVSSDRVEVVF